MRLRELSLFLLFLLLAVFHHERLGTVFVRTAMPPIENSVSRDISHWRYSETSPFHGALPVRVQALTSERPGVVAHEVCKAFGGNVDMLQRADPSRQTVGFNCAFHEPHGSMTADFGELRRTSENK